MYSYFAICWAIFLNISFSCLKTNLLAKVRCSSTILCMVMSVFIIDNADSTFAEEYYTTLYLLENLSRKYHSYHPFYCLFMWCGLLRVLHTRTHTHIYTNTNTCMHTYTHSISVTPWPDTSQWNPKWSFTVSQFSLSWTVGTVIYHSRWRNRCVCTGGEDLLINHKSVGWVVLWKEIG